MSKKEVLQKAIDALKIQDVYVRNFTATCNKHFNPNHCAYIEELVVQGKHTVGSSSILEFETGGFLVEISIELGARFVRQKPTEKESRDNNENGVEVCATIEAEFIAEYIMLERIPLESINEFALKNASFNVWPFWRELLSSQCVRMQLPKIMLPLHQFASNHDSTITETQEFPD